MEQQVPIFASLALRGWFPTGIAIGLAVVAILVILGIYWRESRRVPTLVRLTLAGVRILTVLAIVLLMLRPSWLSEIRGERPKPIAVLIDDSESMLNEDNRTNFAEQWRVAMLYNAVPLDQPIPDPSTVNGVPTLAGVEPIPTKPSRLEIAKQAVQNPILNLLPRLEEVGPVQVSKFGASRSALEWQKFDNWDVLSGQQKTTAMVDAAFDILNRDENELPAAMVFLTDGRENNSTRSLDDLARECSRLKIPLHIFGTGSSSVGQLQIRDAIVQDTLFVDDTAVVPIRYRLKGVKTGKVEIALMLDDKEVAQKIVDVSEGDDLREVLSFVPEKGDVKGSKQELTTVIRVRTEDDVITDEITKPVTLVDQKIQVLFIDSQPRWDFKFIQRGLLRDRRVQASFYLTDGDARAMKSGAPFIEAFPDTRQALFAFDLLIFGDVPANSLTLEQQRNVRDFVAEGRGFIQIAGKGYGPSTYLGTPLADVLPVEIEPYQYQMDPDRVSEGYRPKMTPLGQRSPLLSLLDEAKENFELWKKLPEMYWYFPVSKLKPATDVYLVHPTERTQDNEPLPLLVSHYYGKGFAFYVGFDETWRWRYNEADKYFGRFWSQMVYYAGVSRFTGTLRTQLSFTNTDPQLGATSQLYARLFTQEMKPLNRDRIEGRLENLDVAAGDPSRSQAVELKAIPGQPGEFIATVPFTKLGRFSLTLDNGDDQANLQYRVNLPNQHELATGGMAEEELRQLAEKTGGRFYREEDLAELPASVAPKLTPFVLKEEILLWNRWALLALIILLSLEWFVRKFNSLS